jgi:chromosomal replication initiation ATPase DnaA
VTLDAILSGERFPNTVRARHEWWRLVKDTWDLSYPETARLVGGVDHSSIVSALRARDTAPRRDDKATVQTKKDVSEARPRDALK